MVEDFSSQFNPFCSCAKDLSLLIKLCIDDEKIYHSRRDHSGTLTPIVNRKVECWTCCANIRVIS